MKVRLTCSSRTPRYAAFLFGLLLASWSFPRSAQAGGLYLMPRGAEAAARGGARVAGSDDPQALWYNPAGLLSSGRQLLVDGVLPIVRTDFTRMLDNGMEQPKVSSTSAVPIPTLAYSDNFGLKDWGFGIGLIVPPGSGGSWPDKVNGRPAPQRYSILDAEGTFLATLALGAAYSPVERLSLGVALYLTAAQVGATVALSACDYAFCLQPEAKEWEGRTRFLLGPVYTASAVFGAKYAIGRAAGNGREAREWATVGASLQLKTKISGDAQFDVTLPDQSIFDDVKLQNRAGGTDLKADMEVALPMVIRLGVEFRPLKSLRTEIGGTWENWSEQSSITVNPKGVIARDVPGIGDVAADKVTLARNMRDTWSLNIGGTYDLAPLVRSRRAFAANAGFMYESSSFQNRDLSVTTIDTRKTMIGLGVSYEVARNVLLDLTYGHIFMRNRHVRNSRVLLPAAIHPLPQDDDPGSYEPGDRPAIGNGKYVMEADFVGIGVRWKLDAWQRRGGAPKPPATPYAQPAVPSTTPTPAAPEPAPLEPPVAPAAPEATPVAPVPGEPGTPVPGETNPLAPTTSQATTSQPAPETPATNPAPAGATAP